jgi:CDP-diacylglycerol--glycerol-3-phosphate 3-phosphatidyltransferase
VADYALILPFALIPEVSLLLVLAVTLLTLLSEYCGALGPLVGASRRYDGPMGKSDRAFVLGALAAGVALDWVSSIWINIVFGVVALLLVLTLFNRVRHGLKEAEVNARSA